jgi:fumarylacetoacetase
MISKTQGRFLFISADYERTLGFGTSISPWVVTLEALQPFRCAPKTKQNPAPFPHLKWQKEENATININLQISMLRKSTLPSLFHKFSYTRLQGKGKEMSIATSNLKYLYWTPFQQLAHHASAMCGLGTGDIIGTGTISGDVRSCLFTIYRMITLS